MKNNKLLIGLLVLVLIIAGGYVGYRQYFGATKVVVDESAQGKKIAAYHNPEVFITPYQLNKLMTTDEDVLVIGVLNPTNADTPIAGSFSCWRGSYSAKDGVYEFGGMACTVSEMEDNLSKYGAKQDTVIVIYAAGQHHDATRLWWQIKNLGHKDVRVLDGGLNAWLGAGYATSATEPTRPATTYKASNPSSANLASLDDVIAALDDPNTVIIDTRGPKEESGEETLKGAFGPGKIEGAVHINWTSAVNEDTTLKTKEELEAIYGSLRGKNIITYCQSGVRSAHTLVVLTEILGFENVKNYDGSWLEYSYEVYEKKNPLARIENGQ